MALSDLDLACMDGPLPSKILLNCIAASLKSKRRS